MVAAAHPGTRSLTTALAAVCVLLASCSSRPGSLSPVVVNSRKVGFNADPNTRPFVTVAVDNHFHDIHPEDDPRVSSDRGFVVKNEGRNLHNFTVVGTPIDVDVPAGEQVRWRRIGAVLKPGTYTVVCEYHAWAGMTGTFTVIR